MDGWINPLYSVIKNMSIMRNQVVSVTVTGLMVKIQN